MKIKLIILFISLSPFIAVAQSLNGIEIGSYYKGVKSPSLSYDLKVDAEGLYGELTVNTTKGGIVHMLSFQPKNKDSEHNYFISKKQTLDFIENVEAKFNIKFAKKNRYEGSKKITYYRVTKEETSYYLRTASFDNEQSFLISFHISHTKLGRKYYNRKKEMETLYLKSNTYKS